MTTPGAPGGPSEPGLDRPYVRQPGGTGATPDLLARAARALARAAVDADDAALLAALEPVVVPALGDVAALYRVSGAEDVQLAAVAPADAELAGRLRTSVEREPTVAAGYAAIVAQGLPRVVPAGPSTRATGAAGGLAGEVVAPLGAGAGHDALLAIGSADPGRRYDTSDLAAVEVLAALVGERRTTREQASREAELRQHLEDSAVAGRELAHALNNDLTMPVGVVELLLDRGCLPADLQEMLEAASKDLASLEEHIRAFHELMRDQSSGPAGPRPPGLPPGLPTR